MSTSPFFILLLLLCIALTVLGLPLGAYELSWSELSAALLGTGAERDVFVVQHIRLPRIVLAILVGGGLAMVGAALQSMFRNPLADAGLLGISSGAMLLAACTIVLLPVMLPANAPAWLMRIAVSIASFIGALLATGLVYRIGSRSGRVHVGLVLLAGIAVASFTGAVTGYLIYLSDDAQLRDLTFWTLGSLSGATWGQVAILFPAVALAATLLLREAKALNLLGLGEREAEVLGVDPQRTKRIVVLCAALVAGVSIAFTGLIGFVGLVIPHLIRLLKGQDLRILLPASLLLGAAFLLLTDTLSRTLVAPAELPIGILTALVGAPFFTWLLLRRRNSLSA